MISLAQRIEQLRSQKNIGRTQLSAELGFPKMAIEKFETGRLTPNKEQQEKLARYFGVSIEYLRGESDDMTTMSSWLSGNIPEEPEPAPAVRQPAPTRVIASSGSDGKADDSALFSALLKSDSFKKAVLEVLKTPEGKDLIRRAFSSMR